MARIAAKIILAFIGVGLVFFGVGLLGLALAEGLAPALGPAGGAAAAGGIFLAPPLLWALFAALRPRRTQKAGTSEYLAAIFAGLAKETPWMAMAGTGVALLAELFLKLRRRK